jgi:hypothetical protein
MLKRIHVQLLDVTLSHADMRAESIPKCIHVKLLDVSICAPLSFSCFSYF